MAQPIRWGILGAGRIAAQFAEGLRSARGAALAAVASRSPEKAERLAREVGAARAHGSYAALVADAGVDVVYVATPNALHREHCLLALDAGKPVVCEKPFATSAAEAREVAARARERGLFCMEAMWMRFTPAVRDARARVAAGAIGEPLSLVASLGFPFQPDRQNPIFDPGLGGGALLDLGVYPISLAIAFLGRPRAVQGDALFGASGVDEQVAAVLDFDGGRQAVLAASFRSLLANDAVLAGTAGRLRLGEPMCCPDTLALQRTSPIARATGGGGRLRRLARQPGLRWARRLAQAARVTAWRAARGNGLVHEAEEAMRCLRAGEQQSPAMPLDDSIAALEVVDRLRASWRAAAASSG